MLPHHITEANLKSDGAVLGCAIHHGHFLRPSLQSLTALSDKARLREEDPFTADFAKCCPEWLIGKNSRFEVDLNRPLCNSFYLRPQDAWGLELWENRPNREEIQISREQHQSFYSALKTEVEKRLAIHPRLVVLDFHSYNQRRKGPEAEVDPQVENPEINIGTGDLDIEAWDDLLGIFETQLRGTSLKPRDVRRNVKFQGGWLNRFLHDLGEGRLAVFSVEFSKDFMDEWSGELAPRAHADLLKDVNNGVCALLEKL